MFCPGLFFGYGRPDGKGEYMGMSGSCVAGRYEIKNRIGSGGTSSVYLVTDRHIGRLLAMKVIRSKTCGALRFAKSEIESLRRVRYPLFPAIHDAFTEDGNIYIVSDYVRGECLWDTVKGKGMDMQKALSVAAYIAGALYYLHTLDEPILYLDLKPDNIIMDDEGIPHMIDFGIAGLLAASHIPVGTRGYCPPEQYKSDAQLDERADIFALGMTYYAIRSGVPPDPDPAKAVDDIASSPHLGRSEKAFLLACSALLQNDRYPDAGEVLKQIRHIRSNPYRIRRKIVSTVVAAGAAMLMFAGAEEFIKIRSRNDAAADLVEKTTAHMHEGQYTPEAIGIIRAYINSGSLSKECEQRFMFEVAMNCMLVSKDYKTAAAYFSRLDADRYPEAADYLKLCRMESGFDGDTSAALDVASKLFGGVIKRSPSKEKYENLIFLACCFERYDEDEIKGLEKSLSVLRMAADEIDRMEDGEDQNSVEMAAIRQRIEELESVCKQKIRIRKKNRKMIGDTYEKNKDDH